MTRLLRMSKFWIAVLAAIQTVIFYLVPDFPKDVWQAINQLAMVVIGAIAVEDAAQKIAGNWRRE